MNTPFPQQNRQFQQTNRSNVLGNLWSTLNLDFQENLGVIRLGTRFQVLTKTGDTNATNLGCPVGFKFRAGRYYTVAGSRYFVNSSSNINSAFVEGTTGTPPTNFSSDQSDIEIFSANIWATTIDKLYKFDGTNWTAKGTFGASNVPHMLSTFVKFNRLYVLDDGDVHSIDSTASAFTNTGDDYDLTVLGGNTLTCIKCSSQYVWIGTIAADATGYGSVIQWDGISQQATEEFKIKARGVMAILIKDNISYIVDSDGIMSEFTGTAFEEVGRLPVITRLNNYLSSNNDRFIHPNGLLKTKNNTILAWINNANLDGTITENLASGLWEWSKETGFVHKKPLTYNPYGSSTITDWGQNRVSRIGGIALGEDASASGLISLIVGATYYTDASTTLSGIFIENTINTIQKKGYFVDVWFNSNDINENWTRLWNAYRRFLTASDKIVFKYRNTEIDPIEATITWVTTTSFTTTTDITAYAPTATGFDGSTGGEVEVVQGTGSGGCSHITSIVNNAGTYTVTVDETYTGATGTAKARFQKWIKIGVIDNTIGQVQSWQQLAIPSSNENRIEIKGCMTFTGNGEFYSMIINSSTNVKITS